MCVSACVHACVYVSMCMYLSTFMYVYIYHMKGIGNGVTSEARASPLMLFAHKEISLQLKKNWNTGTSKLITT